MPAARCASAAVAVRLIGSWTTGAAGLVIWRAGPPPWAQPEAMLPSEATRTHLPALFIRTPRPQEALASYYWRRASARPDTHVRPHRSVETARHPNTAGG